MFGELVMNQSCNVKDGYDAIKKLSTKLANKIKIDKDDELEICIDKIFGKDDECENNDLDTIEAIEDDYTGYNPVIINNEETNED